MKTLTRINMRAFTPGVMLGMTLGLLAACGEPQPPQPVAEVPEASSGPWVAARERGVAFRAIGQEPGWYLDIYPEERLHLVLAYGEREVIAPEPGGEETRIGDVSVVTYETEATETGVGTAALNIEARQTPCQDIMSGEAFDYQVAVQWGEERFEGCGRALR
ncbi:hypothetical protein K8B33_07585 [Alcanivorax sp. JB21]|uniref:hypothetical protein n=1 Tax=Alcanivorax limicola TaxID=2874102 RepID=UPI001CC18175|nr:hypothetical protein [Alcanivorax limicola]MBZ2188953.1 hypothetical protein [Alcanivorax limicola]